MRALARAFSPRDVRLIESIVAPACLLRPVPPQPWRTPVQFVNQCIRRGAKTTSRKKIKDLQQGAIQAEPLPDLEEENVSNHAQYPPVMQGVRDNMVKFPNCVVITRVGNFYEVDSDHNRP